MHVQVGRPREPLHHAGRLHSQGGVLPRGPWVPQGSVGKKIFFREYLIRKSKSLFCLKIKYMQICSSFVFSLQIPRQIREKWCIFAKASAFQKNLWAFPRNVQGMFANAIKNFGYFQYWIFVVFAYKFIIFRVMLIISVIEKSVKAFSFSNSTSRPPPSCSPSSWTTTTRRAGIRSRSRGWSEPWPGSRGTIFFIEKK